VNGWWLLLKDVALTGTGIVLIISQMLSEHPDPALIVAGLALTVPSMATHAVNLLSGPAPPDGGDSPSPPSSLPPGSPHSGPSPDDPAPLPADH
jgi:hypothetical protein